MQNLNFLPLEVNRIILEKDKPKDLPNRAVLKKKKKWYLPVGTRRRAVVTNNYINNCPQVTMKTKAKHCLFHSLVNSGQCEVSNNEM